MPYSHLRPAQLYNIFPHNLINGSSFKKVIEHKMCVMIYLQLLSETFLILRTKQDMIKNIYIGLHAKYLLFLSDFNETSTF